MSSFRAIAHFGHFVCRCFVFRQWNEMKLTQESDKSRILHLYVNKRDQKKKTALDVNAAVVSASSGVIKNKQKDPKRLQPRI